MLVFSGHREIPADFRPVALALGNFDGVHIGHRELMKRAKAAATRISGVSAVMTFDPHPAVLLAPQFAPKMISTMERRLELISESGVDGCIVEPFTRELASMEPTEFFSRVICEGIGATHVVVGYDFTFGRERAGTTATLLELGEKANVTIEIVDPVSAENIVASSTKVRNFIGDGNMSGARLLLGRDYDIDGVVVTGEKRGRELGYPTANVRSDIEIIAPTGIYAAWVEVLTGDHAGTTGMAATSLGTNPTFEEGRQRTLEPHILDWSGDIYDQRVRVRLVEYLRPEQRFASIEELVCAIDLDIENTRAALSPGADREKE